MRIFIFSDYHGQQALLPEIRKQALKADLVISAGDHSVFEFDQDETLQEFDKWEKKVILMHGNHEEESTLKEAVKKYQHLEFSHGQEHAINGARILTWGGGGFTLTDKELDNKIKEWQKNKRPTILVTHAPPHDTTLDDLHGRHVGNKTIRKAITKLQPLYAISGHIHECAGAEDKIGTTTCKNVGPTGITITL